MCFFIAVQSWKQYKSYHVTFASAEWIKANRIFKTERPQNWSLPTIGEHFNKLLIYTRTLKWAGKLHFKIVIACVRDATVVYPWDREEDSVGKGVVWVDGEDAGNLALATRTLNQRLGNQTNQPLKQSWSSQDADNATDVDIQMDGQKNKQTKEQDVFLIYQIPAQTFESIVTSLQIASKNNWIIEV